MRKIGNEILEYLTKHKDVTLAQLARDVPGVVSGNPGNVSWSDLTQAARNVIMEGELAGALAFEPVPVLRLPSRAEIERRAETRARSLIRAG